MKANVVVRIHNISSLNLDQLGLLSLQVGISFSARPTISLAKNRMEVRFQTTNVQAVFRTVEALTVTLALSYSPQLWISVSTEFQQEEEQP